MPLPNTARSAFTVVNMLTGPVYNGPNEDIKGTQCWPFTGGLNSSGRPYISVQGKKYLAYRVVYELVTGIELDPKTMLRHKCDNQVCCNPKHLETGDHQQNMDDMNKRERHGLPHHTVRAIRKLGALTGPNSPTHKEIGELYGLARSTVTEILGNVKYKHVENEDEGNSSSN